MKSLSMCLAAALLCSGAALAQTAPAKAPATPGKAAEPRMAPTESARGKLLYETHCISCHSTQVHWRDKRLAQDWTGLQAQVARWQSNAGLRWSGEDVTEVARYLNTRYYRFSVAEPRSS
jgi:mono/diheme cytochrome c family protein